MTYEEKMDLYEIRPIWVVGTENRRIVYRVGQEVLRICSSWEMGIADHLSWAMCKRAGFNGMKHGVRLGDDASLSVIAICSIGSDYRDLADTNQRANEARLAGMVSGQSCFVTCHDGRGANHGADRWDVLRREETPEEQDRWAIYIAGGPWPGEESLREVHESYR